MWSAPGWSRAANAPSAAEAWATSAAGTSRISSRGCSLTGPPVSRTKTEKWCATAISSRAFPTTTVVPEGGLIPLPKDFPLEYACLMGCCIPTGWGCVTNSAKVQPGDSVAVWGLGGVGLNILRAAVLRHAYPVIAVDLEESKEDLAKEFGATHFICNSKEDPVPKIQEITGGGVRCCLRGDRRSRAPSSRPTGRSGREGSW